jgi:hydrogenase maturation protein HypF
VRIFHFDENGRGGTAAASEALTLPAPSALPRLQLRTIIGERLDTDDVIGLAARAVTDGLAMAVKGPAGFQLVCDATSEHAVSRLRALKRGDEKPLAVMVGSLAEARELAELGPEDEALLLAPEGPIVLARRRAQTPLAAAVAPDNPLVGLVLATFPVHKALVERARRPIVVTSGNVPGGAIPSADEEAVSALHGIADLFLLHDAPMADACDDSVARVVAGCPTIMRRARGYARPLPLERPIARPVLGCGAVLTGAFCLAHGNEAVLGPHIGSLDNAGVYDAYVEAIARWEELLDVRPEIIAHDLAPDFPSTRYALARDDGIRHVAVQHHHAHLAAVMAERRLDGPVLGLAYDGGGRGTDGASWGSELLLVTFGGFSRIATFRPLRIAGDDLVLREPWRIALALIDDAFADDAPIDAFPLFARLSPQQVSSARAAAREAGTAMHGAGRYFEGFGALLLDRPTASYGGQTAFPLNMAAEPTERGRYRCDINRGCSPWELDLRPAVRDAVFEFVGGEPVARIAARVHNTIAAAGADLVRAASRQYGRLPVALSGGCFQNARLAESVLADLSPEFQVYMHRRVPPGDGGIALGQAVVADAIARND